MSVEVYWKITLRDFDGEKSDKVYQNFDKAKNEFDELVKKSYDDYACIALIQIATDYEDYNVETVLDETIGW